MAEYEWPAGHVVLGAQAGDTAALAALVSGAHPHVRRFAEALCASPQDAEDAAQEALIILYRKVGLLRATGALASWMFRIVRHECLRRARRAAKRNTVLSLSEAADASSTVESAEEDVLRRLDAERVAAAIAALPVDQRQVLIMRDVQGLPGRTVAGALGLSTAAMKSRLHRARASVRASLAEDPFGAGPGGSEPRIPPAPRSTP